MSLCFTCTSIPFRALDRLFHSDAKTKLAAVLENVVWLDKSNSKFEEKSENCAVANKYHKESADEEQDAEEPELHPWFKHKRAQQISEDASECVLCRFISFELSAMPEERTPYDGEHLEGFYGSSSTSGDSSKNEVIWIKIRKNFFEICRENLIRSGTLNRTVWLRSIADSALPNLFSPLNPLDNMELRKIKSWISSEHEGCGKRDQVFLPTRLLALQSLPNGGDLAHVNNTSDAWRERFKNTTCRLVETSTEHKQQYVALSYCWGQSLPFITIRSSLQQQLHEIRFEQLPKTLQDSLMLARYLDFDYIWIDCLCIIQDDREDWNREAACMADIYSNAALTIAASRAQDCTEGFLSVRNMESWVPVCFEDADGPFKLMVVPERSRAIIPREPLEVRGWNAAMPQQPIMKNNANKLQAYQEQMLSAHYLEFHSFNTVWNCREELSIFEKVAADLETDGDSWSDIVWQYTSRSLTKSSDKLPALSGIIATLQQVIGDTCHAALWKRHFIKLLLWEVEIDIAGGARAERPSKWRAPSWSFAAIDGCIEYSFYSKWYIRTAKALFAELEECNVKPLDPNNPLGELKSGYARVRGPVTPLVGYFLPERGSSFTEPPNCYILLRDMSRVKARINFDIPSEYKPATTSAVNNNEPVCHVLMIAARLGIAIKNDNENPTRYKRVGHLCIYESWYYDGVHDYEEDLLITDFPHIRSITLV